MAAITIYAQQGMGQWQLFPTKSSSAGIVYESNGDMVYYISGSNLFSYDKSTSEIETYNTGNYLSDSGIKCIYYNYNKSYLFIVYENSNIDLIFDNGDVVNIPDLKNTIMMSSKAINDVAFDDDKVYLATDFGLLILNDKKYEVFESYLYNKVFSRVAIVGNKILAICGDNLYVADKTPGLYDFEDSWSFVDMGGASLAKLAHFYSINDNSIFIAFDGKAYIYNVESNTYTAQSASFHNAKFISESDNDLLFSYNDHLEFISHELDNDMLSINKKITLNDDKIKNGYYSSHNADDAIWACSSAGLSQVLIEDNILTWLVEPCGYNTSSVSLPQSLTINNNKLYVKNLGPYNYSVDMTGTTTISTYDMHTEEWSEMVLDNVMREGNENSMGVLRSSMNMAFDSDSSDLFYVGSWFDGLHKFNGSTYVGNYNINNSPVAKPWAMMAHFTQLDSDGNLWTLMPWAKNSNNLVVAMLPKDKTKLHPTQVSESDWEVYDTGFSTEYRCNLMVARKSPLVIAIDSRQVSSTRMFVINRQTGATRTFSTFIDQDGNTFGTGVHFFFTAKEDLNGNIWVGTSSGPIILSNVSNIMSNDYRCTRIKVPRNDGTNFADYLLEDESINTIVVDGANRKWLGTASSGVYLVSQNGTQILQHHSTENSMLPSNMIYEMVMNEVTGELFVGTDLGLASYRSDVSQSAQNYDNVVAFPNPVRPEYSGWVTIQGLMDNTLVKITDVAGNLFSEGYSNGGTYMWDGRTANGERVKTGVYLVFASQSGGTSGVVTKVMVVN